MENQSGFIYNVTIQVLEEIHAEWLNWLKEEHVPDVLNTGCFQKATILRVLDLQDAEGPTYAIQYLAENPMQYDRYIENHATEMRSKSFDKWGNRFIAFRTIMEVIQ